MVFELILNLNVNGNLRPKRTAGYLNQKMVYIMYVAGINLRSQLVREVSL